MVELHGDTALSALRDRVSASSATETQEAYDSVFGARVLDKFERRNGEWRIAIRRVIYDWQRDTPVMETWGRGFFGPVYSDAGKGNADPSFEFFGTQRLRCASLRSGRLYRQFDFEQRLVGLNSLRTSDPARRWRRAIRKEPRTNVPGLDQSINVDCVDRFLDDVLPLRRAG